MLISTVAASRRHCRVRHLAAVSLGVAAVVFCVGAYRKASRPVGYDLHAYLDSGNALAAGASPYRVDRPIWCVYPPFFAVAAIPLTWVPERLVHGLWFLANLTAMVLILRILVMRSAPMTGIAWNREALLPLATALILLIGPIQNHFLNGQCNLLILLVCAAFWLAHEGGRSAWAGLLLALGVSLKLVPGIFVPFLLARRSWRALAWAVFFGALLSLVPGLFLGSRLVEVYQCFVEVVLLGEIRTATFSNLHPHDFTAAGFLAWLVPAAKGTLAVRMAGAAAVIVPLVLVEIRRSRLLSPAGEPGQCADLWAFGAYMAAILLLSPMSETHHLVYLLPAVTLATLRLVGRPEWNARWREAGLLLAIGLLYFGKGISAPLQFTALAGLFALCLVESIRPAAASEQPAEISPRGAAAETADKPSSSSWRPTATPATDARTERPASAHA